MMKRLAGRQTRYVNKHEGRSGSLWDGRFKANSIQTDAYLLQCCRYVELNPVKTMMVRRVEDYPWSSYKAKVGLERNSLLDRDPHYLGLARPEEQYRQFVEQGITAKEQLFIQQRVQQNALTGSAAFVDEIEKRTSLRIEYRALGRPKNKSVPI